MMKTSLPVVATTLMMLVGCTPAPDPVIPGYAAYEPANWPTYAGDWASGLNMAGNKFSTWAAMDVTISQDGTFNGTYRPYVFDYTWMMPTPMGDIPVSVYNPMGTPRRVVGAIDFDGLKGILFLENVGETTFELTIHSGKELAFVYPSSFPAFTVTNIERP